MLITEGSSVSYCSSFSNETEGSSANYNTNYNNNYNNICGDADDYDWIDEIDTNFEEDFRPFASIMDKQQ